ncbi:efflux RND transporter periplasmic adaptor subunit [uncultured Bacteroides sp.]|uniref:efflux RND transporter periplasmic adaptor subunit n=1 Tax=uncultured Bacteroides sp. TaxID=162156 RepID=UPI002AA64E6D|nr:efflux RND transporter periplasmic adaptor subunit [uncultured Bacteroides sp.]
MNKKKKIIIAAIAGVLVIGIAAWKIGGPAPQNKVTFETSKVSNGNISKMVTATGTVEPVTQVEVGTQVSGIVNKLFVDYNSVVKKGQLLAELDKTVLLTDLASKKSSMFSCKTEYEYQLKNYTRTKTLHEKNLVSDTDYETAYYNYQKAKNSYDISKNDLRKAETNLGYAMIYSPIDGVVLSRSVEAGQTVAASFSTPTLFIIANDLKKMRVIAKVDEADIGDVKIGQRVSFTVDAYPNDTFEGEVTQVRQEATTTSNVVTYQVVVNAPNPDLKLKPGLTANITIYTLEKNGVLSVPSKALRFTPEEPLIGTEDKVVKATDIKQDETHKILWKREGKTFTAIPVVTGITNGSLTEIISGVTAGQEIIVDATTGQMPGQAAQASQGVEKKDSETSPFMPQRPGANKKK